MTPNRQPETNYFQSQEEQWILQQMVGPNRELISASMSQWGITRGEGSKRDWLNPWKTKKVLTAAWNTPHSAEAYQREAELLHLLFFIVQ